MVAIVTGNGLGLFNTSLNTLGGGGVQGQAGFGQSGGQAFVNAATGNLILQFTDEQLAGVGQDMQVLRTYNSQGLLAGGNPDGWRWEGNRSIKLSGSQGASGSSITRSAEDGSVSVYSWVSGNRYLGTDGDGAHDTLELVSGEWLWTEGGTGRTETYFSLSLPEPDTYKSGLLKATNDNNGTSLAYDYGKYAGIGRLVQIKDTVSLQELNYTYDATGEKLIEVREKYSPLASGQLSSSLSTSGVVVLYGYDSLNRLTTVTTDLTPEVGTDSKCYLTTYTYDGTSNRVASVTQSDGSSVGFTYELVGDEYRVKTVSDSQGTRVFDYALLASRQVDMTDATGQTWSFRFDADNRLTELRSPAVGGKEGVQAYTYDVAGNVISVVEGERDINGTVTPVSTRAYHYDSRGNCVSQQDSDGTFKSWTYSSTNQLVDEFSYPQKAVSVGQSNLTTPDSPGLVFVNGKLVFSSLGGDPAAVAATPSVIETQASQVGGSGVYYRMNVTTGAMSDGRYMEVGIQSDNRAFALRISGNTLQRVTASGGAETVADLGGATGTVANSTTYTVEFEVLAKSVRVYVYPKESAGRSQGAVYVWSTGATDITSAQFQAFAKTLAGGGTASAPATVELENLQRFSPESTAGTLISSLPVFSRNFYNTAGQLRFSVSPDVTVISGSSTYYQYRVTEFSYGSSGGSAGKLTSQRVFTMKTAANIYGDSTPLSLSHFETPTTGSRTYLQRTDYDYDLLGNLCLETQHAELGAAGEVPASPTLAPTRTRYVRDAWGFLRQTIQVRPSGQEDVQASYAYDGLGRLLSRTDQAGTSTWEYDLAQNSIRMINASSGLVQLSVYDTVGRLVSVADAAASNSSLVLRRTEYKYDAAGRLVMMVDPLNVRTFTGYDAAGRVAYRVDGAGAVTSYEYAPSGRLKAETRWANVVDTGTLVDPVSGSVLALVYPPASSADRKTEYEYDQAGHLTKAFRLPNPAAEGTPEPGLVTESVYDHAGRKIREATGTGDTARTTHFFYDGDGWLRGVLDAEGYFTENYYDGAGRLLLARRYGTKYTPPSSNALVFDAIKTAVNNGNYLSTYHYYDTTGRMTMTVDEKRFVTEYTYDAETRESRVIRYVSALANSFAMALSSMPAAIRTNVQNGGVQAEATRLDAFGRVLDITEYALGKNPAAGAALQPTGKRREFEYDAAGRLVRETAYVHAAEVAGQEPVKSVATTRYDIFGRVTGLLSGEASARLAGNPLAEKVKAIYDQFGETFEFDAADHLIHAKDAAGNLSTYYYDKAGRQVYAINGAGEAGRTVYNAFGEVTDTIRYDARLAVTASDAAATPTLPAGVTSIPAGAALQVLNDQTVNVNNYALYYIPLPNPVGDETVKVSVWVKTQPGITALVKLQASSNDPSDASSNASSMNVQGNGEWQYVEVSSEVNKNWLDESTYKSPILMLYANANAGTLLDGQSSYYDNLKVTVTRDGQEQAGLAFERDFSSGLGDFYVKYAGSVKVTPDAGRAVLLGGLQTSSIDSLIAALANAESDEHIAYTHTRVGQVKTRTDAEGNLVSYGYNQFGELESTTTDLAEGTRKDVLTYDKRGLLATRTVDQGGLALASSSQYDGYGRLVQGTNEKGLITQTRYDDFGRIISITDPLSHKRRTEFDALGRTISTWDVFGNQTRYSFNDVELTLTVQSPEGVSLTSGFDYQGHTVWTEDGDGNRTEYRYNRDGQLLETRDALGHVRSNRYDTAGRLLEEADAVGARTYYSYDAANRMIRKTTAGSPAVTTTYKYDALGRQIRVVQGQEGIADLVTTYTHDRTGRVLTEIVDPEGKALKTTFHYDSEGRQTRVERGDDFDKQQQVVRYEFDKAGRRTAEVVDPEGAALRTDYRYDALGRLTRKIAADGNSTWYVYSGTGHLLYEVGQDGSVIRYTYDGNDRVISTVRYANTLTTVSSFGDSITASDATVSADASRDAVAWVVYDRDGRQRYTIDERKHIREYRYDALGRNTDVIELDADPAIGSEVWSNNLDVNTNGLTLPGSAYQNMVERSPNGELVMRNDIGATAKVSTLTELKTFNPGMRYELDFTLGDNVPKEFMLNLENGTDTALRTHGVYFKDGVLYATSTGSSNRVLDENASSNSAYHLVLETRSGGTTLSVTKNGISLLDKPEKIDSSGWNSVRLNLSVYRRSDTAYAPPTDGQPIGKVSVDNIKLSTRSLTESTQFVGVRTRMVYNSLGQVVYRQEENGLVRGSTYDALGRVTEERQYERSAAVDTVAGTEADFQAALEGIGSTGTGRVYDNMGRLRYTIDSLNRVTETRYDALGRMTETLQHQRVLPNGVALTEQAVSEALYTVMTEDFSGESVFGLKGTVNNDLAETGSLFYLDAANNQLVVKNLGQSGSTGSLTQVSSLYAAGQLYRADISFGADLPTRLLIGLDNGNTSLEKGGGYRRHSLLVDNGALKVMSTRGDTQQETRVNIPNSSNNILTGSEKLQLEVETQSTTTVLRVYLLGASESRTEIFSQTAEASGWGTMRLYITSFRVAGYNTNPAFIDNIRQISLAGTHTISAVNRQVYDAAGRIHYRIDALNRVSEWTYDDLGRVVEERRYTASVELSAGEAITGSLLQARLAGKDYVVNARHAFDTAGREVYTLDALKQLTQRSYDAQGRVTSVKRYAGVLSQWPTTFKVADVEAAAATVLNGAFTEVNYLYDNKGRVWREVQPLQSLAGHADPVRTYTEYSYDALDRVVKKLEGGVLPVGAGPVGAGLAGHARETQYAYDAAGQLRYTADALGYVTEYTYDSRGRKTGEIRYGFTINPLNWREKMVEDAIKIAKNNPHGSSSPAGNTVFEYNRAGELVNTIDALGHVTETEYDQQGQVTAEIRQAANTGETTAVTRYVRDAMGQVRYTVNPLNEVTETVYDALGRVVAQKRYGQPLTIPTGFSWREADVQALVAALGRLDNGVLRPAEVETTRYFYNAAGELRFTIDALNHVTEQRYDILGRIGAALKHANQINADTLLTAEEVDLALHNILTEHFDGSVSSGLRLGADTTLWSVTDNKLVISSKATGSDSYPSVLYELAKPYEDGKVYRGEITTGDTLEGIYTGFSIRNAGTVNDYRKHSIEFRKGKAFIVANWESQGDAHWEEVELGYLQVNTTYVVEIETFEYYTEAHVYVKGAERTGGWTHKLKEDIGIDKRRLSETPDWSFRVFTKTGNGVSGELSLDNVTISRRGTGPDASAQQTHYVYDANGQLRFTVDALGYVSGRDYDVSGRLVKETRYANKPAQSIEYTVDWLSKANNLSQTDAQVTHFIHDSLGQLRFTVDAMGFISERQYDNLGRVVKEIRYTKEPLGSVEYTESWFANKDNLSDSGAQVTRYAYDANNHLRFTEDALGYVTEQRYDGLGRVISTLKHAKAVDNEAVISEADLDFSCQIILNEKFEGLLSPGFKQPTGTTQASIVNGRMIIQSPTASDAQETIVLAEENSHPYEVGRVYRGEVTTGDSLDGIFAGFNIRNMVSGQNYRKHSVEFKQGKAIIVSNGTNGGYSGKELGQLNVNTTYVVEIELYANSTKAFVYVKGGDRSTGWVHEVQEKDNALSSAAWGTPGFSVYTNKVSGPSGSLSLDNVMIYRRGILPDQSTQQTRYFYDRNGQLRFTVDTLGYVTEQRYDNLGRVTATLKHATSINVDAVVNEADIDLALHSILNADFTDSVPEGLTLGEETALGSIVNNRLVIRPQVSEAGWPSVLSEESENIYIPGKVYRGELTTGDSLEGIYAGFCISNGMIYSDRRKHSVEFVDGKVNIISHGENGEAKNGVLGLLKTNTTYVVEIEANVNGTTAYVYEKGGDRSTGWKDSLVATGWNTAKLVVFTKKANGVSGEVSLDNVMISLRGSQPDASAQQTHCVYDAGGNPRFTLDPLNYLTEAVYDSFGHLSEEWRYATPLPSNIALREEDIQNYLDGHASFDAERRGMRYVYDALGQVRFTVDAMGHVNESVYDHLGMVVEKRTYAEAVTLTDPLTIDGVQGALAASRTWTDEAWIREVKVGNTISTERAAPKPVLTSNQLTGQTGGAVTYTSTEWYRSEMVAGLVSGESHKLELKAATVGRFDLMMAVGNRLTGVRINNGQVQLVSKDADTEAVQVLADWGSVIQDAEYLLEVGVTEKELTFSWGLKQDVQTSRLQHAVLRNADYTGPAGWIMRGFDSLPNAVLASGQLSILSCQRAMPVVMRSEQYEYDQASRLTAVVDNEGGREVYGLDAFGNHRTKTDKLGQVWAYRYDQLNRLEQEISPVIKVGLSDTEVRSVTVNEYDSLGHLKSRSVGNTLPAIGENETLNVTGARVTEYEYDAVGRLKKTLLPGYYDSVAGRFNAEAGENGFKVYTESVYDAFGREVKNTRVGGVGESNRITTYKVYDSLSREVYAIDGDGYIVGKDYDAFGNEIQITAYESNLSALSLTAVEGYYREADLTALENTTNAKNRVLNAEFDRLNRKVVALQPEAEYRVDDELRTLRQKHYYEYDAFGDVLREFEGGSDTTTESLPVLASLNNFKATNYYDQNGRMTDSVDILGYLTHFEYDALGNLVGKTEYAHALTDVPSTMVGSKPEPTQSMKDDLKNRVFQYHYDGMGRLTSSVVVRSTLAASLPVQVEGHQYYDVLGRVIIKLDAGGNETHLHYDAAGREIEEVQPQRLVALQSSLDPFAGEKALFSPKVVSRYNVFGEKISESMNIGSVTGSNQMESWDYDFAGNLLAYRDNSAIQVDNVWYGEEQYGVDAFGRRVKEVEHLHAAYNAWQEEPSTHVVQSLVKNTTQSRAFEYNRRGMQTSTTDYYISNDNVTRPRMEYVDYNAFGEVSGKYKTESHQYTDANGAVILIGPSVTHVTIAEYEYDNAGHMTKEDIGGKGQITRFNYSINGQVVERIQKGEILTEDRVTEYEYDALGRVTYEWKPKDAYNFLANTLTENLTTVTPGTWIEKRDRWGNALETWQGVYKIDNSDPNLGAARVTKTEYDELNRVVFLETPKEKELTEENLTRDSRLITTYTYDWFGNVIVERAQGYHSQVDNNTSMEFWYATSPARVRTKSYDNLGRLSLEDDATHVTKTYAYDANGNRYARQDEYGHVFVDTYNANGEVTSEGILRVSAGSTTEYTGQDLGAATLGLSVLKTYHYDQDGHRIATINGGQEIFEKVSVSDNPASGTSDILAMGTAYYVVYDERGNIVQTRNESGVTMRYFYDTGSHKIKEIDGNENWQAWNYNEFGQLISQHDSRGNYKIVEQDYFGSVSVDGDRVNENFRVDRYRGFYTEYSYNASGQIKELTYFSRYDINASRRVNEYTRVIYQYNLFGEKVAEINKSGQQFQNLQINPENQFSSYWLNDGEELTAIMTTRYSYDALGRLSMVASPQGSVLLNVGMTREFPPLTSGGLVTQISYAINASMLSVRAVQTGNVNELSYSYDVYGNRVRMKLDADKQDGSASDIDNWYTYDAEGRVLINEGYYHDGEGVVVGVQNGKAKGQYFQYDSGGRRSAETRFKQNLGAQLVYANSVSLFCETDNVDLYNRALYKYNDVGELIDVTQRLVAKKTSMPFYNDYANYAVDSISMTSLDGGVRLEFMNMINGSTYSQSAYLYDAYGRRSSEIITGTSISARPNLFSFIPLNKTTTYQYRGDGMLFKQTSGDVSTTFGGGNNIDSAGNQRQYVTNSGNQKLVNEFDYRFGQYLNTMSTATADNMNAGVTSSEYNHAGQLVRSFLSNGAVRYFANSPLGQAFARVQGSTAQIFYTLEGKQLLSLGGLEDTGMDTVITPISDAYPEAKPGSYLVNFDGESLRAIAQAVWGDSTNWYLIADANGLMSDEDVKVGMRLTIPNVEVKNRNDANSMKPYDPSEVTGDLTPTPRVKPPKKVKWWKKALIAIVAIVVTFLSGGLLAGLGPLLGNLIAGALGSIASQLTSRVLGVSKGFDWKRVGAEALTNMIMPAGGAGGAANAIKTGADVVKTFATIAKSFVQAMPGILVHNFVNAGVSYLSNKAFDVDNTHFNWASVGASSVMPLFGELGGLMPGGSGFSKLMSDVAGANIVSGIKVGDLFKSQLSAMASARVGDKWFGGDRPDYASVAGGALGGMVASSIMNTKGYQDFKESMDGKLSNSVLGRVMSPLEGVTSGIHHFADWAADGADSLFAPLFRSTDKVAEPIKPSSYNFQIEPVSLGGGAVPERIGGIAGSVFDRRAYEQAYDLDAGQVIDSRPFGDWQRGQLDNYATKSKVKTDIDLPRLEAEPTDFTPAVLRDDGTSLPILSQDGLRAANGYGKIPTVPFDFRSASLEALRSQHSSWDTKHELWPANMELLRQQEAIDEANKKAGRPFDQQAGESVLGAAGLVLAPETVLFSAVAKTGLAVELTAKAGQVLSATKLGQDYRFYSALNADLDLAGYNYALNPTVETSAAYSRVLYPSYAPGAFLRAELGIRDVRLGYSVANTELRTSPTAIELIQQAAGQPKRVADISLEHIFNGEVKPIFDKTGTVVGKRGVGGHYIRSANIKVTEIVDLPDINGVMKARIEIRDPQTGGWVKKQAPSDFFPDHWSKRQIEVEIKEAFYNSKPVSKAKWEGVSPSGVRIQGYYKIPDGTASTAWPVYEGK